MPGAIDWRQVPFVKIFKLLETPSALNKSKYAGKKLTKMASFNRVKHFPKISIARGTGDKVGRFQVTKAIRAFYTVPVKLKQ